MSNVAFLSWRPLPVKNRKKYVSQTLKRALILYVHQVNNFSLISGWFFLGWTQTKQIYKYTYVLPKDTKQWRHMMLEPATSQTQAKHSTA